MSGHENELRDVEDELNGHNVTVYEDINADSVQVHVVESLCFECGKHGETRLMLTKIPHFREVIISSFECPHCGYKNTGVESGTEIADRGVTLTLTVSDTTDLNRQVIKSEYATLKIPCLEFEIPPKTQPGLSTTVEGLISRAIEQLDHEQPVRKVMHPELFHQLEKVIAKLKDLLIVKEPYQIVIDDNSGLSHIECPNYNSPEEDTALQIVKYQCTTEQLNKMGFYSNQETSTTNAHVSDLRPEDRGSAAVWNLNQQDEGAIEGGDLTEVFVTGCGQCGYDKATQRVCEVQIPGFKTCLIMAFVCDNCGHKDSEVKPSGDISDHGREWILKVMNQEDLNRDVIISGYASLKLPDIGFETVSYKGGAIR